MAKEKATEYPRQPPQLPLGSSNSAKKCSTHRVEAFMSQDKALVRELAERIEGVTRTWFELEIEGHNRKKTLVVEVSFDLDANSAHFLRATCDAIEETVATVLREENSDMVSKLKIVNRAQQSADKSADAATSRPGNRTTREMRAVGMVMARDGA
jgi:hypothetical protein